MIQPDKKRSLPLSIWRERDFRLFWLGSVVSEAGTLVTAVILPILIFRLTGDPFLTALVGAFRVIPYLLFGLVAGAIADHLNRRSLMIVCDILNTLLLGTIPLAALQGFLTLPHLYLVAFLSATVFVWFDAANWGALPSLVGRERIVPANSALSTAAILSEILAPLIAGSLASFLDPALVITLDVASYLVSALCLAAIARPFNPERARTLPHSDQAEQGVTPVLGRTVAQVKEGLSYIWQNRLVRILTLAGFGNSFTGGAVVGLLVVYGIQNLHLTQTDARLGLLYSAGAVGSLLTSLGFPFLVRHIPIGLISLIGLSLNPLMVIGMVLAGDFLPGSLFYLVWSSFYQLVILNGITLRQKVTPENLLSRVNTTARMIAWGGTPFGAAIGGGLVALSGIKGAYLIMTGGVLLSAALAWFSPLRQTPTASASVPVQTGSQNQP